MKTKEFVSMQDVEDAITEKIQFYKVWLERGVIDEAEFNSSRRVLTSLEDALRWKSKKIETKEIA